MIRGSIISIHTPVKGVTFKIIKMRFYTEISIHTPVKGVTKYIITSESFSHISIHTPVKGVTVDSWIFIRDKRYFNPHTREGCDM